MTENPVSKQQNGFKGKILTSFIVSYPTTINILIYFLLKIHFKKNHTAGLSVFVCLCVLKKKQMNNCIGFIKNRDFQ